VGPPVLDPAMQAEAFPREWVRWGSVARTTFVGPNVGYHFYTGDDRFNALARRAWMVPASGCSVAVEPNYSTRPGMSECDVAAKVALKRSLARSWQAAGVRVVVDLNVDPAFRHLSLSGVPPGWRAYATRQHQGIAFSALEDDWRQAAAHAGTADVLFFVFGGWKKVRDLCAGRGWFWTPEDIHRARGSTDCTRRW
jgi:hypothetical protein